MEETYSVKLPLFEGPMDLLLHLIREQKIDIYDIPIALITRQYLEYLEMMKELNLDIAGDFLVLAATLIHIKSRMLLPIEETADTEEPEDPRLELVIKLLEYQAFKDAALGLREREDERSSLYTREPSEEEEPMPEEVDQPLLFELNLYDLIHAFRDLLEKAPAEVQAITRETLTMKDKMALILDSLQHRDAMRFTDLFRGDLTRTQFIVTFLALLEILRLGVAKVYQEGEFGTIWVINPEVRAQMDIRALMDLAEVGEEAAELPEDPAPRYTPPVMDLPARRMALPARTMTGLLPSTKRPLPHSRRKKR
jgi:segregation and condensation protein A